MSREDLKPTDVVSIVVFFLSLAAFVARIAI